MERTLLLNTTYEPLRIISWKKAITLVCQGKVEIVDVYDKEIRGITITFKLPSILRLLKFVNLKRGHDIVKFSRANIFARDSHACQYCGDKFKTEDLTFDHVIPVANGGKKTWENIVTACIDCNNKKGNRTPGEARMHLVKKPEKPGWMPTVTITIGIKNTPESWRDYLYWNIELQDDA